MKNENYNPYRDFKKYGNPMDMNDEEKQKRLDRIYTDQQTKLREDKYVWGADEIEVVMPEER
jgi:hypothetical protein